VLLFDCLEKNRVAVGLLRQHRSPLFRRKKICALELCIRTPWDAAESCQRNEHAHYT
jgi:hypothetical protein